MWKKKKKPIVVAAQPVAVKPAEPEIPRRKRMPNFYPHEVCNAPTVYRCMAAHVAARERYDVAIKIYTTAAKVSKDRKEKGIIRIKRAQCHLGLCNISKARRDISKAKQMCPELLLLQFQRGNVLYHQSHFEKALVAYQCGAIQRIFPDFFRNGVNIAEGTIENCVGKSAGAMLSNDCLGKIIIDFKLKEMGLKETKAKILNDMQKKRMDMLLEDKKRQYAERYLGSIAQEKTHMMAMLTSPGLFGTNKKYHKIMENLLISSVQKLELFQDCLWKRKPLYVFDFKKGKPAAKLVQEWKTQATLKTKLLINDINRQMGMVLDYYENGQYSECYKLCEYLRARLWRIPDVKGLNKEKLVGLLIDTMGDVYFAMKVQFEDWPQSWNDKRILSVVGINPPYSTVKEIAKYSFHYPVHNAHEKIKDFSDDLRLSSNQYQRMYFNFEIACLFSMINNLPQMRSFARQALFASRKEGNIVWYINCLFLLARTDLEEGNLMSGMVTMTAVREACAKFGYTQQMKFANRAVYLLSLEEPKERQSGLAGIAKREKNIIDLMPTADLKSRAKNLLREMNQKPQMRSIQVAFQSAKKSDLEEELERERQRRQQITQKRQEKKAAEEAAAAAETESKKWERYKLPGGPLITAKPETAKQIIELYKRRSTFCIDMFHS